MTWLKQNGPRPDHLGLQSKTMWLLKLPLLSSKWENIDFIRASKWTLGIMMTDIGSRYILVGKIIFTKTNRSNSAFSSCLNIGIKLSQWWIRITLKTETLRWTNIISHPQQGGQRIVKNKAAPAGNWIMDTVFFLLVFYPPWVCLMKADTSDTSI